MLLEDVAVICQSFIERNNGYYQYLDRYGENDLGNVVNDFYKKLTSMSNDDLRKILGYADPQKYDFDTEDDRTLITILMNRNFIIIKKFFDHILQFRTDHIQTFRRYKHAGYTVMLSIGKPSDDVGYQEFDFFSLVRTASSDPTEEMTAIPFSAKVLKSYQFLLEDIFDFLRIIITYRIHSIERKVDGMLLENTDPLTEKFDTIQKQRLAQLNKKFDMKFPSPVGKFENRIRTRANNLIWYVNLDNYVIKNIGRTVIK